MDKSHDSCAAAFLFQLFNVRGSIASKGFVQLLTGQFNWINLSFRFYYLDLRIYCVDMSICVLYAPGFDDDDY